MCGPCRLLKLPFDLKPEHTGCGSHWKRVNLKPCEVTFTESFLEYNYSLSNKTWPSMQWFWLTRPRVCTKAEGEMRRGQVTVCPKMKENHSRRMWSWERGVWLKDGKIMSPFNYKMHNLNQTLGIFKMYTYVITQWICIHPADFSLQHTRHINQWFSFIILM